MTMTNEELARRIQHGEQDLLLQLWEQVRRYAHDRAYKWHMATNGRGGQTVQDLEQEAFLALLEALEGWTETAGPFLPWYSLRLKAAFTAATGQRTKRDQLDPLQNCISLDAPLTDREGDPFTLEDSIPDQRAEEDLDKIEKQLLAMPDPEALDDLLTKKEAAQAMYDELKETLADAESLAMTGQPRQTVKAAQEVQWFTSWGHKIGK